MKSFVEIIKMETVGPLLRGAVRNKDLMEFLGERPTQSRANIEAEIVESLGKAGFNTDEEIRIFVSPSSRETIYEQKHEVLVNEE